MLCENNKKIKEKTKENKQKIGAGEMFCDVVTNRYEDTLMFNTTMTYEPYGTVF